MLYNAMFLPLEAFYVQVVMECNIQILNIKTLHRYINFNDKPLKTGLL